MSRRVPSLLTLLAFVGYMLVAAAVTAAGEDAAENIREGERLSLPGDVATFFSTYCLDCHHADDATSGIDLESLSDRSSWDQQKILERVSKKLRSGQMPPADAASPEPSVARSTLRLLDQTLDRFASEHPKPGRTDTFRRLTRYEYENSIDDLLGLKIDAASMLPPDEVSHGFDNITVGELSPTLINRYISAAQKISRLAVGTKFESPDVRTVRLRPDVTQEERMTGLPPGTRGGTLIDHHFPNDGTYELRVRLTRDRNEHVEGLHEPHELDVLLDGEPVDRFTVRPPGRRPSEGEWASVTHENVDRHLKVRLEVTAGPHQIAVAFVKKPSSLLETKRQPLNVHYNMYRHPRLAPAVYQVSIAGPFQNAGISETPSRAKIFICRPGSEREEDGCAKAIFANLMRRACRGPVDDADLEKPMAMYRRGRERGDFEEGIEWGLSAILVHPRFLFRMERAPEGLQPGEVYAISDLELASRLSFFLWSRLPDEPLLTLAEQNRLRDPEVLRTQVMRMLRDQRSQSLVESFAGQWLYLRNLDSVTPDARRFPDFDDNLRQAFRKETELFFESVIREDRNVLDLLNADYTYLNERLAKHYGISQVHGTRFRRVALLPQSHRGGLLRQGSILTVTSYATRTSPVIRGKWILENILGTPPPPPPPNVPALEDNTVSANLSVRERLAQHRSNPACASCHNLIDPVGFCLENYDAVGRLRYFDEGGPIDATGGLPDGQELAGVEGLLAGLNRRPELFVETLTEKLFTYAIGRGYVPTDAPAVRRIVRDAAEQDYRFSELVLGIVNSTPFQMRTAQ